jgi:predicted NodU family carbamoyl transferase
VAKIALKFLCAPLVLNTSFNENEPIVETPAQALDCFMRTDMGATETASGRAALS